MKLNKLESLIINSNENYSICNNSIKEILDKVLQLAATVSSLSSRVDVLRIVSMNGECKQNQY